MSRDIQTLADYDRETKFVVNTIFTQTPNFMTTDELRENFRRNRSELRRRLVEKRVEAGLDDDNDDDGDEYTA